MTHRPLAVLFDLDGTLIDSAPDLAGSANDMRIARGMIGVAMGIAPGDAGFDALRDEFFEIYARRLLNETRVFDAVEPVLREIEALRVPWGIVTNKAQRYTTPVVEGLGLHRRAAVVVSGDTTAHAKPHPEPLLEAARRIGVAPHACIYVGDDFRDVQAGRAAGMKTVVAAWGYLGKDDAVSTWGADIVIDAPHQLLKTIGLA